MDPVERASRYSPIASLFRGEHGGPFPAREAAMAGADPRPPRLVSSAYLDRAVLLQFGLDSLLDRRQRRRRLLLIEVDPLPGAGQLVPIAQSHGQRRAVLRGRQERLGEEEVLWILEELVVREQAIERRQVRGVRGVAALPRFPRDVLNEAPGARSEEH